MLKTNNNNSDILINDLLILGNTTLTASHSVSSTYSVATKQYVDSNIPSGIVLQNGNTLGATLSIGTNDNQALSFKINDNAIIILSTNSNIDFKKIDFTNNGNRFFHKSNNNLNLFVGFETGLLSTSGTYNVGIGEYTQHDITTGNNNTTLGSYGLYGLKSGNNNVAIGYSPLVTATATNRNVAVGAQSLYYFDIVGDGNNTGVGDRTLVDLRSGIRNVAIGAQSGWRNRTGNENVYIGYQAGLGVSNNSHSNNTLIGSKSALSITTGSNNTLVGHSNLGSITTGNNNISLGYNISGITTGSNNIIIGNNINITNNNNQLIIGNFIKNRILTDVSGNDVVEWGNLGLSCSISPTLPTHLVNKNYLESFTTSSGSNEVTIDARKGIAEFSDSVANDDFVTFIINNSLCTPTSHIITTIQTNQDINLSHYIKSVDNGNFTVNVYNNSDSSTANPIKIFFSLI